MGRRCGRVFFWLLYLREPRGRPRAVPNMQVLQQNVMRNSHSTHGARMASSSCGAEAAPLPGGYRLGETLFYIGASAIDSQDYLVVHGQAECPYCRTPVREWLAVRLV